MFQPNVWNIFRCPSTTVETWQALRKKQSRWPFFIPRTHYPSGRTWANLCSLSGYLCVSSIKTGTRRIMRPNELPFVVRRSRRISKESSSILYTLTVFICSQASISFCYRSFERTYKAYIDVNFFNVFSPQDLRGHRYGQFSLRSILLCTCARALAIFFF